MNCKKCDLPIPDNCVTCPYCLGQLDLRVQRSHQVARVAQALDGTLPFLTYTTIRHIKHLRRYDFKLTFCGADVIGGKNKCGQLIYDGPQSLNGFCQLCLNELAEFEKWLHTGHTPDQIAHAILHAKART